MKCTACGKEIADNAKFCRYCGSRAISPSAGPGTGAGNGTAGSGPLFCTVCGAPLQPGAKFCTGCGTSVQGVERKIIPPGRNQDRDPGTRSSRADMHGGGNRSDDGAPKPRGAVRNEAYGNDHNDAPDGEEYAGSGRRILLIIVIVIVVLAAVAGGVFFLKSRSGEENVAGDAEETAADAEEDPGDGTAAAGTPEEETSAQDGTSEDTEKEDGEETDSGAEISAEDTDAEEDTADPVIQAAVEEIAEQCEVIERSLADADFYTVISFVIDGEEEGTAYCPGEEETAVAIYTQSGTEIGTDRSYYYDSGELIYACYEGTASHRFYYQDGELIRWIYCEDAEDEASAVTTDLGMSTEYSGWESRILSEAASMQELAAAALEENQEYILEGSDSRYIDESELYDLSEEELRLARNEIYARHGRIFNDDTLTEYFSQFDWYEPAIDPDDFSDDMLNEYELDNLELIVNYEKEMGYR